MEVVDPQPQLRLLLLPAQMAHAGEAAEAAQRLHPRPRPQASPRFLCNFQ